MMQAITLYELNNLVRFAIEHQLNEDYWLQAELSEVRESRGHCYVEFVQKDAKGNGLVAKARGQVWANRWLMLRPHFERVTGRALSAGMLVLVRVQLTFHELYGYSLNVVDIDPTYTLGDIARRRMEIMRQLEAEGVATMNKELSFPRLLQRIAVISSPTAAGYGDFCDQLKKNRRGLAFQVRLFPAVMQGTGVEGSVIAALNEVAESLNDWDVVVIIRGGGATSDLSGFDTLGLAENVAQFPLPVITGIGHERDDTVIDLVAKTRVKTPTAAAEFLIHHQEMELEHVLSLAECLATEVRAKMNGEKMRTERIAHRISLAYGTFKSREERKLDSSLLRMEQGAIRLLDRRRVAVDMGFQRISYGVSSLLMKRMHRLEMMERQIDMANPERIFRLGFSVSRVNGHAVTDASLLKKGDVMTTTFASGMATSVVSGVCDDAPGNAKCENNDKKKR